jgi:uncharacterized protein YidB (DUF937 family)
MLEELLNSVKSEVGGQLAGSADLPSGGIEKIFSTLGDTVKNEATGQILSGNLSHLMNLFSNQPNTEQANEIQSNIHSGFVENLMGKLGLSSELSNGIAAKAVPALINAITRHNSATPDNDPSPLHELFGTSGSVGFIEDAAKNILGKFLK